MRAERPVGRQTENLVRHKFVLYADIEECAIFSDGLPRTPSNLSVSTKLSVLALIGTVYGEKFENMFMLL